MKQGQRTRQSNSKDGRLNFAQQAESNLRLEYKPNSEYNKPTNNAYPRNNQDRPVSQEEIRSALTLLKAKLNRDRMLNQQVQEFPQQDYNQQQQNYYQKPKIQPQEKKTISYEDVVAKDDKKPIQLNEYEDDDEELIECPEGCGRKFKDSALAKHIKVCRKVFQEKRKAFDTKEQRIINQDHAKLLQKQEMQEQIQQQQQQKQKQAKYPDKPIQGQTKPKWKQQSEQFRAAMKTNKGVALTQQEQIAIEENDDRILCDYCGRKFNDKAAEKHIPSCKEKSLNNQMKKKTQPPLPNNNNNNKFNSTRDYNNNKPPQTQQQQQVQSKQQFNNTNNFTKNTNSSNGFTNTQTVSRRPPSASQRKQY